MGPGAHRDRPWGEAVPCPTEGLHVLTSPSLWVRRLEAKIIEHSLSSRAPGSIAGNESVSDGTGSRGSGRAELSLSGSRYSMRGCNRKHSL